MWLACGAQLALEFMLGYLVTVHTPAHYLRCWRRRRWGALCCAALATALAYVVARHVEAVRIGHAAQRLVAAHVWTEWSVGQRYRPCCGARDA